MNTVIQRILIYLSVFLALIVVLPFHEYAHAFVAVKCGDNTPKINGRLTLNPFAHFDILGLLCFVIAKFGWAKPVPVNPNNYKHFRRDSFFVAIAGVLMNYIIAFVAYPLYVLSLKIPTFYYFTYVLQATLYYMYSLSITFFVFNLLPIYPLDGFRVYEAFSKGTSVIYRFLKKYGIYILYLFVILSFISDITGFVYIDVLGYALNFLGYYIAKPITLFWGLFL